MRSNANPLVFTKLELILQRLLDSVQHGYTHVASGQTTPTKALRLASKFDVKYQVCADKNLRARRKRNGLGNAKWLCFTKNEVVYWWLLVTKPSAGEHLAHSTEKLVDVAQKGTRLGFQDYELVELPYAKFTCPRSKRYKERSKPARLTWRICSEVYENIRVRIIEDVRSCDMNKLVSLLCHLYGMPGFGGVRSQVGKLVAHYTRQVKIINLANSPTPPSNLKYVRRLSDSGIRLFMLAESYLYKISSLN